MDSISYYALFMCLIFYYTFYYDLMAPALSSVILGSFSLLRG